MVFRLMTQDREKTMETIKLMGLESRVAAHNENCKKGKQ